MWLPLYSPGGSVNKYYLFLFLKPNERTHMYKCNKAAVADGVRARYTEKIGLEF
jgi:hypothetical protein